MGAGQGRVVRIWRCYRGRLVTGWAAEWKAGKLVSCLVMADSPEQAMKEPTSSRPNAPETCGHRLQSLSSVSKRLLLRAINASFRLWLFFWKWHQVYSIKFIPTHQASSQKIT